MTSASARRAARSRSKRGSSGPRDASTCAQLCQRGERAQRAHSDAPAQARGLRPGRADALITLMVNKTALDPARKRRGRGRPKGASAGRVRERLLEAARELFLRYGYRAVASRQIRAVPGVNFAMIRYFFLVQTRVF